jgi:hypothetical protein
MISDADVNLEKSLCRLCKLSVSRPSVGTSQEMSRAELTVTNTLV